MLKNLPFTLCLSTSLIFVACSKDEPKPAPTPEVSQEEPEPIPKEAPKVEAEPEVVEEVVEEPKKPSPMELALIGQTLRLEDGVLVRRDIEKKPKYYILYFSAEWSGSCKAEIGRIKTAYQSSIAKLEGVELVMVSIDSDSAWMHQWAKKERFTWPMVMHEDLPSVPILKDLNHTIAHHFVLLDSEGERLLAYGFDACLEKATELAGE